MVGFLGLFSIILQGFYLGDLILTWNNPIKYMASQKYIIPIFLLGAKIG
jgi:hypothetical protein